MLSQSEKDRIAEEIRAHIASGGSYQIIPKGVSAMQNEMPASVAKSLSRSAASGARNTRGRPRKIVVNPQK